MSDERGRVEAAIAQNYADNAPDFEGLAKRECGEHRTTGRRAWCFDCSEWCYPHAPCKGCELPLQRRFRDEPPFSIVRGYVRDAGGGVVTVVVARDTESYPPEGVNVLLIVETP